MQYKHHVHKKSLCCSQSLLSGERGSEEIVQIFHQTCARCSGLITHTHTVCVVVVQLLTLFVFGVESFQQGSQDVSRDLLVLVYQITHRLLHLHTQ